MTLRDLFVITLCTNSIIGCATSSRDVAKEVPVGSKNPVAETLKTQSESPKHDPSPLEFANAWSPHFVRTGLSTGIMVQFTGLKKHAKLGARYSGIELWRYPEDSVATYLQTQSTAEMPGENRRDSLTLTSTINYLRQAFFKVSPGIYLFRQTKNWADQSYIRGVEVREGNYSVVTVAVLKAPPSKAQQLSPPSNEAQSYQSRE